MKIIRHSNFVSSGEIRESNYAVERGIFACPLRGSKRVSDNRELTFLPMPIDILKRL